MRQHLGTSTQINSDSTLFYSTCPENHSTPRKCNLALGETNGGPADPLPVHPTLAISNAERFSRGRIPIATPLYFAFRGIPPSITEPKPTVRNHGFSLIRLCPLPESHRPCDSPCCQRFVTSWLRVANQKPKYIFSNMARK